MMWMTPRCAVLAHRIPRLFADENFPHPVVVGLRALGHDVVTLQETGAGGLSVPDDVALQGQLVRVNRLDP